MRCATICHAVDLPPTVLEAAGPAPRRPRRCRSSSRWTAPLRPRSPPTATRARPADDPVLRDHRVPLDRPRRVEGDHRPRRRPDSVWREQVPGSHDFAADHWALYRLDEDFAEAHDVAAQQPERVAELPGPGGTRPGATRCCPWRTAGRRAVAMQPPPTRPPRAYRPGGAAWPRTSGRPGRRLPPRGRGRRPDGGAEGVLCAPAMDQRLGVVRAGRAPVVAFTLTASRAAWRTAVSPTPAPTRSTSPTSVRPGGGPLSVRRRRPGGDRRAAPGPPLPLADRRRRPPHRPDAGFPVCDDYTPPFPVHGDDRPRRDRVGRLRPPVDRADVAAGPRRPAGVATGAGGTTSGGERAYHAPHAHGRS